MPLTPEQLQQAAQSYLAKPKPNQAGQSTSQQSNAQQPAPEPEFDYKTSQVNQKGESLPAGAKQWTPMGQPYFGPGIGGTLKRYAWTMMGNPNGQNDANWTRFLEMAQSDQFWNDPTSKEFKEGVKTFGAGIYGTDKNAETAKTDWAVMNETRARFIQLRDTYGDLSLASNRAKMSTQEQAEYKELQKLQFGSIASTIEGKTAVNGVSLLAPFVRGAKVAVQATLDALSEAAIKVEQGQGVNSAMRDYAQANSDLPALASNIDRTEGSPSELEGFWSDPSVALKSESAQEIGNITSRLMIPVLNTWDAFRFWTAPGTKQQKMDAIQGGWDAGRILYSQAIKPSLVEEFKRRAAAGEDPQLLAEELQNPWAEAIGQGVFDPLTVVGALTKGIKAANMLDKATDAVRGGSLGDEAVELLEAAGKTPLGETTAAGKLDEFDALLTKSVDRIENQRLTVDFNKATSYSPTGLRIREGKTVQAVSTVATSSIMRNGGTADDVADFFHNIAKAVSGDKSRRLEAWDEIFSMSKRFGLGRYAFSDDVLETGILLRNLSDDKDLLTALKAGKGDLFETAQILNRKLKSAIEKQIPSYTEVKTLAEKFRMGEDVSTQAKKAAKTYEGIKTKALWNLHEGTIGKAKSAINSTLGKFYFSQPGFAVRNFSGNMTTMLVDSGFSGAVKSVFRDGKFYSIKSVEDDLMKWFGGKMPPGASGITMVESENALTGVAKFNDNVEKGFAKRIYWKNFKDTMDKMLTPGVALPKREEFKAIGLTDGMIDEFVQTIRNDAHGSADEAIKLLTERSEPWKKWRGALSPDEVKGVNEIGIAKEINDVVDTATTPAEIKRGISKLKREVTTRANSATDNPIGVNREREGFEFMEGIGKASEEGLMDVDGTNKLNILIEQSERASDELMRAIGKARDKVADPALREQFSIMESVFSSERRGAARTVSQQLTDTALELTKQSRKSTGLGAEALWNKSILAKRGPAPAGLTPEQFRNELWQATRNDVSNNWEMYFAEGFDKLTPLVDNLTEQFPDIAPIFAKSQKTSAELNVYRTAIYRDGKIFYQQPPKNIRELASRYGIATATAEGIPQDKQLLATINKYAGQKYKTLEEVPLEEAEKALQARRAGAQTTADAARVEQPKAVAQAAEAPQIPTQAGSLTDETGEPMTLYHATNKDFAEFSSKSPSGRGVTFLALDPDAGIQGAKAGQREGGYVATGVKKVLETNVENAKIFGLDAKLGDMELPESFADENAWNVFVKQVKEKVWSDDPQVQKKASEMARDSLQWMYKDAPDGTVVKANRTLGEFSQQYKTNPPRNIAPDWQGFEYNPSAIGGQSKLVHQEALKALGFDGGLISDEAGLTLGIFDGKKIKIKGPKATDEASQMSDELGEIRDPSPNPEVQIQPPYVDGSTPIPGQMWKENSDGILNTLNKVEAHMLDNYGIGAAETLDGSQLKALKSLMKDANGRITEGMAIADKVGKEWRDFTLLPYGETKNFDLALSYAFPYQFWYSRSYANWMQRVATDPQIISNYARIKETMSQVNKDSPEWWRYNVEIPSHFLGLPNEHPMSFNLEANIWPLYGLTGTDFNDPQKRQNWMTATIDDMGKLGPSTWAPIQWAIALMYKAQGEDELAQAFGGRIIPQTSTIKAVSSYFGKPLELDPGVQLFSGKGIMDFDAMDKYERNRVGRALTAMVQSGELTEEQAVEIARTQEGAAWDEAVKRATQIRAPGQISSFFLGVGMKARTEEDRITDEFYEKYYRLQNLNEADLISPEKYQQEWDGLRNEYPFMDALLLSRKAGPDRDRAYAYNVLGRIPPGQASELYKLVGIDSKTAQKFYDSKGNIKDWNEAERERFIAATVDLGAMLAIPDYATKQDWNTAKNGYKAIRENMAKTFGADIQDKIDQLFSIEDKDARDRYVQANPVVNAALQWQNEQVVNNPDVYEFYGGLQALEKFHKGKVYDTLEAKYGADIQKKFDEYYQMQITDPKGAKSFYRLHPELKKYNEEKTVLMEQALRQIVEFGARLPDNPMPELTGNEPESVAQQNIQDYATQTTPGFDYWQSEMPEVSAILSTYWNGTEKIPYAVKKNLDYQAAQYGFQSGDDLLQAILISMQR
jgi:hypothetical protein